MTVAAKARGVRDTRQVLDAGFPAFAAFRHPDAALGRAMISHVGLPSRIGGVLVHPGDVVLGDMDGTVVVPRALAVPVLEQSEESLGIEEQRDPRAIFARRPTTTLAHREPWSRENP